MEGDRVSEQRRDAWTAWIIVACGLAGPVLAFFAVGGLLALTGID